MTKELQQCLALTIWPTFNQGACCVSLHDPVRLGITIAFLLAIYYNYASCCAGLSSVAYLEKPFKFRVQKCCERSSYICLIQTSVHLVQFFYFLSFYFLHKISQQPP